MKFARMSSVQWSAPARRAPWIDNLELELHAWEGTPYESGQSCRGVAADCIGAAFGVLDALERNGGAAWRQLPADTALHDRISAVNTMRALIRRYPTASRLEALDGLVMAQPGDVLVMGPRNGAPGHVGLVGPQRNTIWHATQGPGFRRDGWGLSAATSLVAVYRIRNRNNWA